MVLMRVSHTQCVRVESSSAHIASVSILVSQVCSPFHHMPTLAVVPAIMAAINSCSHKTTCTWMRHEFYDNPLMQSAHAVKFTPTLTVCHSVVSANALTGSVHYNNVLF
jgi:hypothetical protein